jgi:septal ring factor EnvC (AmiA/AmiB activator)
MPKRSADDLDSDHTDELPILLETVGLEDRVEPVFVSPRHEDTEEHPALHPAGHALSGEELAELTERAEQIPALEAQIRVLTDTARDLEQTIAEKDRRLEQLDDSLAELRRTTGEAAAADQQLANELALRDAQVAELTTTLERAVREAAAVSAELQRARDAVESAHRDADGLRSELAARPARVAAPPDVHELREQNATLTAYIEGRRSWWEGAQATNAHLSARVAALEHDLKSGATRLAAAEAFAASESKRAVALRAELVEYARRVDALEREQRLARATDPPPPLSADTRGPIAAPPPTATQASAPHTAAAASPAGAASPAATASPVAVVNTAPPQPPSVLTEAVEAAAPAVEAIAQLEAEVEYKRQQVAAQLVELRDREQRLRTATSDLGTLRTELDDSRANVARLERTLADKDRALEARDTRIATLHEELKQRTGSVEKRSGADFSLPPLDSAGVRPGSHDGAVDNPSSPVLICLTGDAPRRFPLTKKTITVGRGPQCDLQILTHFVSREHARLTFQGGTTLIEDLGSRNGVFVNSVRVDRRNLQQGDLVTIGETQFRFVESMAH